MIIHKWQCRSLWTIIIHTYNINIKIHWHTHRISMCVPVFHFHYSSIFSRCVPIAYIQINLYINIPVLRFIQQINRYARCSRALAQSIDRWVPNRVLDWRDPKIKINGPNEEAVDTTTILDIKSNGSQIRNRISCFTMTFWLRKNNIEKLFKVYLEKFEFWIRMYNNNIKLWLGL